MNAVKPPKIRVKEHVLQTQAFRWLSYQYRQYDKLIFHIPNGGSRHAAEAANLKLQGVKSGVSDIIFLIARCGFHHACIEMKRPKEKPTQNQHEFLLKAYEHGAFAAVIDNLDDFMDLIKLYEANDLACLKYLYAKLPAEAHHQEYG